MDFALTIPRPTWRVAEQQPEHACDLCIYRIGKRHAQRDDRRCTLCCHGGEPLPVAEARALGGSCGPDADLLNFAGLYTPGNEPPAITEMMLRSAGYATL